MAAEDGPPSVLPVTQILSANGAGEDSLLPSALYLPAGGEFGDSLPTLPWEQSPGAITGRFARQRGALAPDRLVHSAKSWLSHPHADPRGAILPWNSSIVENKMSPLDASRRILGHLLGSLRAAGHAPAPGRIVITVPASFDEAARGLTLEAAREAGLGEATLLEEPQAAFYAWLEENGADWRSQVRAGDLLLVCDVGGGTADFSLIAVTENQGDLALERVAVGEHLLLGGDNMDLALAHRAAEKLEAAGTPADSWQFLALVQEARAAKEKLLAEDAPASVSLSAPSRGRKLVGSTLSTVLERDEVRGIVIDGFFPLTGPGEMPALRRAGGVREAGLPYAADAAISKHLARFLSRALANLESSPALKNLIRNPVGAGLLVPDAVLFNGGVFHSSALRKRVLELLGSWSGGEVRELGGARPDHAVAVGAAAYARLRATGRGLRIKAGTARSYYLGMESAEMAVPGRRPPVKGLCVAPQGMEEGTSAAISGQTFFLYTGEDSEFRFFHSETRAGDAAGFLLPDTAELEETACLSISIPPPEGHAAGEEVPVTVESRVTELGNLELYFVHPGGGRWKLEFRVRLE